MWVSILSENLAYVLDFYCLQSYFSGLQDEYSLRDRRQTSCHNITLLQCSQQLLLLTFQKIRASKWSWMWMIVILSRPKIVFALSVMVRNFTIYCSAFSAVLLVLSLAVTFRSSSFQCKACTYYDLRMNIDLDSVSPCKAINRTESELLIDNWTIRKLYAKS